MAISEAVSTLTIATIASVLNRQRSSRRRFDFDGLPAVAFGDYDIGANQHVLVTEGGFKDWVVGAVELLGDSADLVTGGELRLHLGGNDCEVGVVLFGVDFFRTLLGGDLERWGFDRR